MATQTQVLDAPVAARKSSGLWRDAFGRLAKNRLALVGLFLVALFAFVAIFGPWLAPYDYKQQDVAATAPYNGPIPPMTDGHVLGTDQLGRDLLSRIMDGAQISFTVAIVVQVVVLIIGILVGAMAGWFGGRLDNYLMRFTDVIYAFPDLLFIIILTVAFRETWFGRALDGLLLVFERHRHHVVDHHGPAGTRAAALTQGDRVRRSGTRHRRPRSRDVSRHLLPNAIGPVIVAITLGIPGAILAEATLAFLGIAQAPRALAVGQPDRRWPRLHSRRSAPSSFPALAVAIALLSFTFLGTAFATRWIRS